ncbi:hypothetical protein J437_LFUL008972 [Ladona fulva]|uniref:Uncharacterized protein n=1 Tax=Ladona fulva TaxID=123851 RepID=A0A8K0P041_LADFU|nr:hypothetical protein J437_LFUL008972 [Ladona fulva]
MFYPQLMENVEEYKEASCTEKLRDSIFKLKDFFKKPQSKTVSSDLESDFEKEEKDQIPSVFNRSCWRVFCSFLNGVKDRWPSRKRYVRLITDEEQR